MKAQHGIWKLSEVPHVKPRGIPGKLTTLENLTQRFQFQQYSFGMLHVQCDGFTLTG